MATKRFITYKCNKCQRTKDYETDKLHAFVNLCTITKNCTGKLSPIATKNLRNVLPSTPVEGLEDWGSTSDGANSSNRLKNFPLVSSSRAALTLIAKGTELPDQLDIIFVAQQENIKQFIEYDFYKTGGTFTTIMGTDTSPAAKLLNFSKSDTVKVYADGVELIEGTDVFGYVLNFEGNIGYSITLNTARTVSTFIKVIVFSAQLLQTTQAITFSKNSLLTFTASNKTAWSNINSITIDTDDWTVYTCEDTSALPLNSLLNVYPGNDQILNIPDVDISNFALLLSYTPYLTCDRVYDKIVKLSDLSSENNYIRAFYENNQQQIQVSNFAISSLASPINLASCKNWLLEWETANAVASFDQDAYEVNNKIIGIN